MNASANQPLGVGLIGCGTVGSGVVKLLIEQAELYTQRIGRPIHIARVLCRAEDVGKHTAQVPDGTLVHDVEEFFDATDDMDVIIELAGGTTFARDIVARALQAGKHVITANKALLAKHGGELFAMARQHGVAVAFEASCGGGIPYITALQHNLMANRVEAMYGILNGTSNYILTQMTRYGETYADALADAQERGYAEADPALDVNGGDAAHKLAILGSLAFGAAVIDDHIPTRGIEALSLVDVHFGAELGYELKLLAIAERVDDKLAMSVAPCFVSQDDPLAEVRGSFNAISVFGHAVGHTMYYGRGAGQMPTASAVVGDLINLATGSYGQLFDNLNTWPDQLPPAELVDLDEVASRYYIRFDTKDSPGVFGRACTILGEEGVSIAAVSQHEAPESGDPIVPVMIITHAAGTGAVRRAVQRIEKLPETLPLAVCMRIVDMPEG